MPHQAQWGSRWTSLWPRLKKSAHTQTGGKKNERLASSSSGLSSLVSYGFGRHMFEIARKLNRSLKLNRHYGTPGSAVVWFWYVFLASSLAPSCCCSSSSCHTDGLVPSVGETWSKVHQSVVETLHWRANGQEQQPTKRTTVVATKIVPHNDGHGIHETKPNQVAQALPKRLAFEPGTFSNI